MADQTIKSFLVRLGYNVDESGHARFEESLASAGMQATKLGAAVVAAGAAVTAFATKVASGMDQLYFASQRTGATVQGIQSIGYAASQTGSSAQAAQGALEGLARFVRNNPGGEAWINRLGVQTRNARGEMRDTADVFMDIGQRLQRMPFFQRNQFAQQLGIDEKTLIAMSNGMRRARNEYNGFAHDIGYNGQRAARESHGFMTALRRLYSVSGLLSDKIGSDTAGSLTNSVNYLTQLLVQGAPYISQWEHGLVSAFGQISDRSGDFVDALKPAAPLLSELTHDANAASQAILSLLGIDFSHWNLQSELDGDLEALRTFSRTLGAIGRIMRDIRTGNFHDLPDADRALWNAGQQSDNGQSLDIGGSGISGDAMGSALAAAMGSQRARDFVSGRNRASNHNSGIVNAADSFLSSTQTLADRNNNPGNIRSSNGGFRNFGTALQGWQAMSHQLLRYYNGQTTGRRLQNVHDIISTWAPGNENNTAAYIRDVAQRLHVNPNQRIDLNDSSRRLDLMRAIARHEGFHAWRQPDARTAANNTTVNVTVHGNGDAHQIGREVSTAVNNANSRNSQVTGARSR